MGIVSEMINNHRETCSAILMRVVDPLSEHSLGRDPHGFPTMYPYGLGPAAFP